MRIAVNGLAITRTMTGIGRTTLQTLRALLAQDLENEYFLFLPLDAPETTELDAPNLELIQTGVSLTQPIKSLLFEESIFSGDPATGATGSRLAENVPSGRIDVPLLVAQGESDELITPTVQSAYVVARCRNGGAVDYRLYPGLGHRDLVADDSPLVPELLEWTRARFAEDAPGPAADSGC